jgi:hypothetical protein
VFATVVFNCCCFLFQEQFLAGLDLAEFARVFEDEGISLEDLQQCSADELKVASRSSA